MSVSFREVAAAKKNLEAARATLVSLQSRCQHKFKLVAQKHIGTESADMAIELECKICGLTQAVHSHTPWCPVHAVEMQVSYGDEANKIAASARKELDAPGHYSYCDVFVYFCSHTGCKEHMTLIQHDR